MSKDLHELRKQIQRSSRAPRPWVGVLGNSDTVEVGGRPGYWYVRPKGASLPLVVRGGSAPGVANTEVWVGRDIYRRRVTRILDTHLAGGSGSGETQALEPHAASHYEDGSDPVSITTRQVTNGLVYAHTGLILGVYAGWVVIDNQAVKYTATAIDMTSHVPGSGARYCLIRVNAAGVVSVQDGTPVAAVIDLGPADVPLLAAGYALLAIVRMYYGQTAISRLVSAPDVLDLRFSPRARSGLAETISIDTTNFDGNLSAADDTLQAALDTLDDVPAINELNDVPDVVVAGPMDGDVLTYQAATQTWLDSGADKSGWTASASHNNGAAANTVDGNDGTDWNSNTYQVVGMWIKFDLAAAKRISQVDFYCDTSAPWSSIGVMQASATGSFAGEQVVLTSEAFTLVNGHTVIAFDQNVAAYRYYRYYITVANGAHYMKINEVDFLEEAAGDWINAAPTSGVNTFVELADAPADYTGDGLKLVRVNTGETALEFAAAAGIDTDALHDNVSGEIVAITEKSIPVAADLLIIEDSAASNAKKRVQIGNLTSAIDPSWTPAGETWTYAGADDPAFTFTISGDQTGKYGAGMRVKLTQTTVKYFIVTKVEYSSPNTTVTIYGGTDYDLANAAITSPYYSVVKAPVGFPLDPTKWTVEVTDSSQQTQATPTQNVWYNNGSISISIPIGCWRVMHASLAYLVDSTSQAWSIFTTLSTANNSESDADFTAGAIGGSVTHMGQWLTREKYLALTTKTAYYLNERTAQANLDNMYLRGDLGKTVVRAVCAYL